MLETLNHESTPKEFVDWMEIERIDGHAVDIGLFRHWVDPMLPFAAVMLVLVIFARHSMLPPALGMPYVRGER